MKKIKENWKIIIILILTIIFLVTKLSNAKQETIEEQPESIQKEELTQIIPQKIKIDIKGEIQTPGVYELEENSRISDAVDAAGGLTENADTELINLSKNLKDEMVIIIYNKNQIEKLKEEAKNQDKIIEYIEKECKCPDNINDACINPSDKTNVVINDIKETKISINKAELEELKKLPGLGESKAKAIIEYREKNGKFEKIEDITKVSGIGSTTFEKFKDYITI